MFVTLIANILFLPQRNAEKSLRTAAKGIPLGKELINSNIIMAALFPKGCLWQRNTLRLSAVNAMLQ